MLIRSGKDFGAGLVMVALALALGAAALRLPLGQAADPGPGYLRLLLAGVLAALGLLLLGRSMALERDGGEPIGRLAWRPVLMAPAAVMAVGLAPRLGLPWALALAAGLALGASAPAAWGARGGWATVALLALAGALGVWLAGDGTALTLLPVGGA